MVDGLWDVRRDGNTGRVIVLAGDKWLELTLQGQRFVLTVMPNRDAAAIGDRNLDRRRGPQWQRGYGARFRARKWRVGRDPKIACQRACSAGANPLPNRVQRGMNEIDDGASMTEVGNRALLPDGLRDGLPPDAGYEADIVARLLGSFGRYGYDRVTPPLVEFEDTLLHGAAASIANATFRLMDPVSQRMMGVRADMTLQVARIATTRLTNAPRPLRLAYAGQVLRVRGSQLRPEREFRQAGVELIGASDPAADAEVISLAATALSDAGVSDISVDITLPTLVPGLCESMQLDETAVSDLRLALDRKDVEAVGAMGEGSALFSALLRAAGPASESLARLAAIDLPFPAKDERQRLTDVVDLVQAALPNIMITIDPVEHRGFEYHTGLSFTLFARGVRGEIGRGGRYCAGANESATGFSLFLDSIMRAVPDPQDQARVFLPFGLPSDQAAAIRSEGWIGVAGLLPADDARQEARRLGCTHTLENGRAVSLDVD